MSVELDELPLAAILLDADRRIVAANDGAAELTGRGLDDLIGLTCGDVLAPADGGGIGGWDRASRLRSIRGLPEHSVRITKPDGTVVTALASGRYRRNGDGTLTGALLLLRPAHARGNRTPTGIEVISTVSHELRSPLTSVKGYTSLLLNRWERLKDEQKMMMLQQVHHDADRVTRLVTELLDISRLETGRLVLRRQRVDLPALAASVVEKVGMQYEGLECAVDFADGFPEVYADADKIEQVLTNLVENAAKYASPAGMRVTGTAEDDVVRVAVSDVGEGIPAADLPRVFTKFFRRNVGKPTGSGLGLWISRGLVEAHGGRLTAESTEGTGSVFAFTLPLVTLDEILERS